MIGGTDIVMPAKGDAAALDACARVIGRHWPQARFEDAITGEKFRHYSEIPIGRLRELLAYPNAEAESKWDADSSDSPPNSMLYIILSDESVTAVLDDASSDEMRSILDSMRAVLQMDILNTDAEAYAEAA